MIFGYHYFWKHPNSTLSEAKLGTILVDRLIPWTPLRVDRGILPVGPTKSLTFSRGPKGCQVRVCSEHRWLEDGIRFRMANFQWRTVSLKECTCCNRPTCELVFHRKIWWSCLELAVFSVGCFNVWLFLFGCDTNCEFNNIFQGGFGPFGEMFQLYLPIRELVILGHFNIRNQPNKM